jgi:hypothetical protein
MTAMLRGLAALTVTMLAFNGCAPPASQGTLDSDNPAAKLYAVRKAGEAGDKSAIPKLVEALDNDDPAVRMMAIHALEKITGERLGFNPYGSVNERRECVDAWEQAVRDGRFGLKPADSKPSDQSKPSP